MDPILTISEIRVSYYPTAPITAQPQVKTSEDCYNYLLTVFDKDTVQLKETKNVYPMFTPITKKPCKYLIYKAFLL